MSQPHPCMFFSTANAPSPTAHKATAGWHPFTPPAHADNTYSLLSWCKKKFSGHEAELSALFEQVGAAGRDAATAQRGGRGHTNCPANTST